MQSHFLERIRNISENYFLNFYFLNVDISLTMNDLSLEGTVSQIFDIALSFYGILKKIIK